MYKQPIVPSMLTVVENLADMLALSSNVTSRGNTSKRIIISLGLGAINIPFFLLDLQNHSQDSLIQSHLCSVSVAFKDKGIYCCPSKLIA